VRSSDPACSSFCSSRCSCWGKEPLVAGADHLACAGMESIDFIVTHLPAASRDSRLAAFWRPP